MKGSNNLNTYTNFLFIMADIMECNLLELQELMRKEGSEMRFDIKRQFNIAIKAIRNLSNQVINKCDIETQEYFADDSDVLNALIRMLVDRYGDNHYKALRIYNILEKLKSEDTGIPLCDKYIAFSGVIPEDIREKHKAENR